MKRFLLDIFTRPLLVSDEFKEAVKAHRLAMFGQPRLAAGFGPFGPMPDTDDMPGEDDSEGLPPEPGIAVIGIHGPLVMRQDDVSYQAIRAAFDAALADDAVGGIVLDIDSPGGTVHGAFDLADHIYQNRGAKPITAMINEQALSAGYLLASPADRIIIPRTGMAGSIGVLAMHRDFSKAEAGAGIKITEVYAGAQKTDYSPHHPISKAAVARLQAEVDKTYALFVDTVARNRGLSSEAVRATEAGIFTGQDAVDAGLADEVAAVDTALSTMVANLATASKQPTIEAAASVADEEENIHMDEKELREKYPELVSQIEASARGSVPAPAGARAATDTPAQGADGNDREAIFSMVAAAAGEDTAKRIRLAMDKGLTLEDMQALGVPLTAAAPKPEDQAGGQPPDAMAQMLSAITKAAPDPVNAGVTVPRGTAAEATATESLINLMVDAGSSAN